MCSNKLENCERGRSLRYKNFSKGTEKSHEIFEKTLSGTGPKFETGASLIESSSHAKLTTMFSGNNEEEVEKEEFKLL